MPRPPLTEEDLQGFLRNMGKGGVAGRPEGRKPRRATDPADDRPTTVEVTRKSPSPPRYRSKLEARWASYLEGLKVLKVIDEWKYEPMNFRLPGKKNYYKVDFATWLGKSVTFYEVKGRNKSDDASLVKLKTAAALHPWAVWIQVKWIEGEWKERVME